MIGASNMAPGAEHDSRSGCDDDTIYCPKCGIETYINCHYCGGLGMVSRADYAAMRLEEQEESEANE